MFAFCADPGTLQGVSWWLCYLTTPKHVNLYIAVLVVPGLLALVAPLALGLGLAGALARRSAIAPVRWAGAGYSAMVRGIPDIVFFLFVPIAVDQGLEYLRHRWHCPDWPEPVRQGNDFVVCAAAKLPLTTSPPWVHETHAFLTATLAFAVVFGAFAANTLHGALQAIPKAQIEAAASFGLKRRQIMRRIIIPQMWIYALPGLSNIWMILVKATPLLFLLGIEDVVYWARELGGTKTDRFAYPHGDWRLGYFLFLLGFYLLLTWGSERIFERLTARVSRGMTLATGP